ncbi:autotransporter domain-containing protein [Dyella sp. 2RAB6]|uniref:autotransporter domain-containing protein n=1 Tax=Dyella sp. 2RAB6 TaxID=3232992 RepID=UPI003F8D9BC9
MAYAEPGHAGAGTAGGIGAWRRTDRRMPVLARILPAPPAGPERHRRSAGMDGAMQDFLRTVQRCRAVAGAGLACLPLAIQAADAPNPRALSAAGGVDVALWSSARLAQGELMMDGLHRRLGEIRNVMPTRDIGGEAFVRHVGGHVDRLAGAGGRDAHSHAGAVQLGGSLADWDEDGANQRIGWALDRGRLSVRSGGIGHADDRIDGLAAWYTRQRDNGAYLDAVVRRASYTGRVRGDGTAGARVRASQWLISAEVGAPLSISENVAVEPQVQWKHQTQRAGALRDGGALRAHQATLRLGARVARIDNERFVPYAQLDLERQFAGRSRAAAAGVAASDASAIVRNGTVMRLSAGVTIKVHRSVDIYADAGIQRGLADGGRSGGSFNTGLRINF